MVTGAMVDCRRDSLWQKLLQVTETFQIIRITCLEALPTMHITLGLKTLSNIKMSFLNACLFQETEPGHVNPHVSLSHVEFLELISLVSGDVSIMMITP